MRPARLTCTLVGMGLFPLGKSAHWHRNCPGRHRQIDHSIHFNGQSCLIALQCHGQDLHWRGFPSIALGISSTASLAVKHAQLRLVRLRSWIQNVNVQSSSLLSIALPFLGQTGAIVGAVGGFFIVAIGIWCLYMHANKVRKARVRHARAVQRSDSWQSIRLGWSGQGTGARFATATSVILLNCVPLNCSERHVMPILKSKVCASHRRKS